MPTPDKILMRKIKKREKNKLKLIAAKTNVTENGKGNLLNVLFLCVLNTCVEHNPIIISLILDSTKEAEKRPHADSDHSENTASKS